MLCSRNWHNTVNSLILIYFIIIIFIFICLFIYFAFSRATPMAYGGSQTRGLIGAVAAGLCHSYSNSGSELLQAAPSHVCNLHHSLWQCWFLNPLSEAKDRTHNLIIVSRIHFHCTTTGTPLIFFF